MKLYRFLGRLIDLELISSVYADFGEERTFQHVDIRVEFILGAPTISLQLSVGAGLGGPDTPARIAAYKDEVARLEKAWAACGRTFNDFK